MSATEKAQEIQAEDPHANSTAAEIKRSITIDTLHNDEAVKVLANYTGPETWDQKEEKRLVKRIDRRLLPILCTTYGIVSARILRHCIEIPNLLPRPTFLYLWPEPSPLHARTVCPCAIFRLPRGDGRRYPCPVDSLERVRSENPSYLRQERH